MREIKKYKVEIFVSKRIILSNQSHKFDLPFKNIKINQLNHYKKIIIECVNLKFLFNDVINRENHFIDDFLTKIRLFAQDYNN